MKKLVRPFALLCSIALLLACFAPCAAAEEIDPTVTINVYNWGEYISNGTDGSLDVNAEFTRRTGIKVNYTTFDTNESLYSKLVGGGADYDVIFPSDYMVSKLIGQKMLAPINFENLPNYQYIDEQFRDPVYDPGGVYSVPYDWNIVGLFYNKEYVTKEVKGWDILWDADYAGKILMFDNPRDAFMIAQFRLGQSINSVDPEDWRAAAELLKEQRPLLQGYYMDQVFDKMENGEAWLAPYYAGDAAILVDGSDDIGFVAPQEGTNFFVDAMCIPATSSHKREAEAYINFLCDPEIAGANMNYVGYSTPETAAKAYMDEETLQSPIHYPSEEILANTEAFVDLPEDISKLVDTLWAEVKMGGPGDSAVLIAIILGFLAVYLAIIFYQRRKRKRELA